MPPKSGPIVESSHADIIAYAATFENLRNVVRFSDAALVTTLPRGGLQITQPRRTDPQRMRLFGREMHAWDVVAWQAMSRQRTLRVGDFTGEVPVDEEEEQGDDVTPFGAVAEQFREKFLRPHGIEHYAAVPLDGPVLRGYPGVLQLLRTREAGEFTGSELRRLRLAAKELDEVHRLQQERERFKTDRYPLAHLLTHKQFGITRTGEICFPSQMPELLDDILLHNLVIEAKQRFERHEAEADVVGENGQADSRVRPSSAGSNADRLLVADRLGDRWAFRLTYFPTYPALTGRADVDEPVILVSHQPECEAWSTLRPSDFAADDEIGRLIPALQYMQTHYMKDASLQRVAKVVHLSPFHFHRRFTDLLGITPKHYIFDCQIGEAKRRLSAGDMDLRQLAEHCGFAHQSHFTSRFKQATGLTPTRWRRLATEVDENAAAVAAS
jgi:AraC-like DNA-binding protein